MGGDPIAVWICRDHDFDDMQIAYLDIGVDEIHNCLLKRTLS
jgi:hypothetical protein